MDIKEDRNRLNEVRRGNNVFELPRDQLLNLNHVHNNQTITSQLSGQELLSAEEEGMCYVFLIERFVKCCFCQFSIGRASADSLCFCRIPRYLWLPRPSSTARNRRR